MFQIQKHWAVGDAEFAVRRLVRDHPGREANPASAAALRVVVDVVSAMVRQAPVDCHVGLRVMGEFLEDGRGGVNIGVSFMRAEEAKLLDEAEESLAALGAQELTLMGVGPAEAGHQDTPPASV